MTVSIYSDDDEDLEVEIDYCPPTPDVPYLSNGDPGYPGDDGESNIIEVRYAQGGEEYPSDLSPAEIDRAIEAAQRSWQASREDDRF